MNAHPRLFILVLHTWLTLTAQAATPLLLEGHFYDEASQRHLTLSKGEFGSVKITVRFAGDPGSDARWEGQGKAGVKDIQFAQIVGEDQTPGTYFLASLSESKAEISFKPGQKEPQDAGINGTYRRLSETKQLQVARKEYQAAEERLATAIKNASRIWSAKERPALAAWKEQWPSMNQRWLALSHPPQANATAEAQKTAAGWLAQAQAAARGYSFVEAQPDMRVGPGWDGEYDDFGGGHASLRVSNTGTLRVTLSYFRFSENFTSELTASAPTEAQKQASDGTLTAEFQIARVPDSPADQPEKLRLSKYGRYIKVETEPVSPAQPGKGWFDGIYRATAPAEP